MAMTFLSSPKPFRGYIGEIQRRAIRSWQRVSPDCDVVLYGDEPDLPEVARELGVGHVAGLLASATGAPMFGEITKHAAEHARHDLQTYINGDIVLTPEFERALRSIPFRAFLMIGQRIDLGEGVTPAVDDGDWRSSLAEWQAEKRATLHPPYGSDYFAFRRGLWADLPPIIIGRGGYDNALIAYCLSRSVPVVDATLAAPAFHQYHDYTHVAGGKQEVFDGEEANVNYAAIGSWCRPILTDATHYLSDGTVRPSRGRGDWARAWEMRARFALRSEKAARAFGRLGRIMDRYGLSQERSLALDGLASALGAARQAGQKVGAG